jgi:hypothetical protein
MYLSIAFNPFALMPALIGLFSIAGSAGLVISAFNTVKRVSLAESGSEIV